MLNPKECLCALDHQGLEHVYMPLTLVVAFVGIALRVFVGKDRAGGLNHRSRGVILRRDQADRVEFVLFFLANQIVDFRVSSLELFHNRTSGRGYPPSVSALWAGGKER